MMVLLNNNNKLLESTHPLKRKGVFTYDYMSNFERFDDIIHLKKLFYAILNDEHTLSTGSKGRGNVSWFQIN